MPIRYGKVASTEEPVKAGQDGGRGDRQESNKAAFDAAVAAGTAAGQAKSS